MISFAFSLALWVLVAINRRVGNSWLYPPTVFASVWAMLLLGLAIVGDSFYPVSAVTFCVYLVGALSFSLGGALCAKRLGRYRRPVSRQEPAAHRSAIRIIIVAALVLVACFPFYWQFLQSLGETGGYANFWIAIRAKSVDLANTQWTEPVARWDSVVFGNIVTFALLFALVGVAEGGTTRRERWLIMTLVVISLVYSTMMAANAGAASLLFAIVGIQSIRKGRVNLLAAILSLVTFVAIFTTIAIALGKGRANPSAPLADNIAPTVEAVEWYTFGGVAAFDRVVQDPSGIPPSWSISRFFLLTANKLGASFDVPPLHAEYTMVSPSMKTNVYTMYFAYFAEYGWVGISAIPLLLGFAVTWVYQKAAGGSKEALVIYGLAFSGIVLSGFNEGFFLALNTLLKAGGVVLLVFSWPRWWRKRTLQSTRHGATVPSFAMKA